MKRLILAMAGGVLLLCLAGCGPTRKSVFPPLLSVQQLHLQSDGSWDVTLHIQNNSYTGMTFTQLHLHMMLQGHDAGTLDKTLSLAIPQLAADVTHVHLDPRTDAARALAAIANKGSSASVTYRFKGSVSAIPDQEKDKPPRTFQLDSKKDWLSPVPGIANTFR